MELIKLENGKVTSLELVKEINFFRNQDGRWGKANIAHKDLLKVIRDEFDTEIREGNISPSQYDQSMPTGGVKAQPMFELTINQAKQVLVRESKLVRKAVIKRLDELENKLPQLSELEMIAKIAANHVRQEKRLDVIEDKIDNRMGLTGAQAGLLGKRVGSKVYEKARQQFNVKELDKDLKDSIRPMFSELNRILKNKFEVSLRSDIPQSKFDDCLEIVDGWFPSFETMEKVRDNLAGRE